MQAESQPLGEKGVGSVDAMTFLESQCFGTFGFPFHGVVSTLNVITPMSVLGSCAWVWGLGAAGQNCVP